MAKRITPSAIVRRELREHLDDMDISINGIRGWVPPRIERLVRLGVTDLRDVMRIAVDVGMERQRPKRFCGKATVG